jgi:hypothetical protein
MSLLIYYNIKHMIGNLTHKPHPQGSSARAIAPHAQPLCMHNLSKHVDPLARIARPRHVASNTPHKDARRPTPPTVHHCFIGGLQLAEPNPEKVATFKVSSRLTKLQQHAVSPFSFLLDFYPFGAKPNCTLQISDPGNLLVQCGSSCR